MSDRCPGITDPRELPRSYSAVSSNTKREPKHGHPSGERFQPQQSPAQPPTRSAE